MTGREGKNRWGAGVLREKPRRRGSRTWKRLLSPGGSRTTPLEATLKFRGGGRPRGGQGAGGCSHDRQGWLAASRRGLQQRGRDVRLWWRKLRTLGLARFRANLESRIELHHWLPEGTLGTCDCCDSASGSLRASLLLGAWFSSGGCRCQVDSSGASMPSRVSSLFLPRSNLPPPFPSVSADHDCLMATGTCLTAPRQVQSSAVCADCREPEHVNNLLRPVSSTQHVAGYCEGVCSVYPRHSR